MAVNGPQSVLGPRTPGGNKRGQRHEALCSGVASGMGRSLPLRLSPRRVIKDRSDLSSPKSTANFQQFLERDIYYTSGCRLGWSSTWSAAAQGMSDLPQTGISLFASLHQSLKLALNIDCSTKLASPSAYSMSITVSLPFVLSHSTTSPQMPEVLDPTLICTERSDNMRHFDLDMVRDMSSNETTEAISYLPQTGILQRDAFFISVRQDGLLCVSNMPH